MAPLFSAGKAEFAPEFQSTSSRAGGSLTIVMSTSEAVATSRGDAASFAPAATREPALEAVRFHTTRGNPALRRLWHMGLPMRPRPMKPTVGCDTEIPPRVKRKIVAECREVFELTLAPECSA